MFKEKPNCEESISLACRGNKL